MSRKNKPVNRQITPDYLYHSQLVNKLINYVMKDGKKSVATRQIHSFLMTIKKTKKTDDPVSVLEQAIDNIKPKVEVRPRRIGGAVYQVPTPVRGNRQLSLALRWLVSAARKRPNKQYHLFHQKLVAELEDCLNQQGEAFKKRQDVDKMAEANKAFSHLRW